MIMSTEENKAVVIRMNESANRHDLFAMGRHPGMQETKEFLARRFRAFPDTQATIEEMVAEGEWVAVRMVARGTHQGEWEGKAPTGRTVVSEVLAMHRIVDGRIVTSYSQGRPLDGAE
jgi:predicted ester cyclase